MSEPKIKVMGIGDVAYGIAVQAIEGKWPAEKLGPYIARFAIDYATEVTVAPGPAGELWRQVEEFINILYTLEETMNKAPVNAEHCAGAAAAYKFCAIQLELMLAALREGRKG